MASSQHCVQLACSRGLYIGWRLWRLNYRTHSGEEQVDVRTNKQTNNPSCMRIWCCFEESIAVEERNKGTLGNDFALIYDPSKITT